MPSSYNAFKSPSAFALEMVFIQAINSFLML
jgi:hypothetical protein